MPFQEQQHPRGGRGTPAGGKFAPKGGGGGLAGTPQNGARYDPQQGAQQPNVENLAIHATSGHSIVSGALRKYGVSHIPAAGRALQKVVRGLRQQGASEDYLRQLRNSISFLDEALRERDEDSARRALEDFKGTFASMHGELSRMAGGKGLPSIEK